jgi:hypothetical protein
MKQISGISILIFAMLLFFSSHARCGEEEVLEALETVKTHVEAGVSPETLAGLLDEARIQIDGLGADDKDDCFREAVRRCYYWYDLARKSRETMIENQQQRDKYDREAIFGEVYMRTTYEKMVANYEQLIRHTYEALPSKWAYGNTALQMAYECLQEEE